jgi:hypothetical protein
VVVEELDKSLTDSSGSGQDGDGYSLVHGVISSEKI